MEHLITAVIVLLIALPCYFGLRRIVRIVAGKAKGCGCSTSSTCTCSESAESAPDASSMYHHSCGASESDDSKEQQCQCGSECQCKQHLACEQSKQGAQESAQKNEAKSGHISL